MKPFANTHSLEETITELQKCDVVCANCHCRRTAKRRHDEKAMREMIRAAKGIN